MRHWRLLPLLFMLLFAVAPVHAIPAEFTAWLYTPDTGRMSLVDLSGEVESFELPLTAQYDTRPYATVAVSPDGYKMAYVVTNAATNDQQLMVYDYQLRAVVAQYPIPNALYNSIDIGGKYEFSPDSQLLAFGYSTDPAGWELLVIDLTTYGIAGMVRSSDAPFTGHAATYGVTPAPSYFVSRDRLVFSLILGGTDAHSPAATFTWDIAADTIAPSLGYGLASDIFTPTGEAIISMEDARFASSPHLFMLAQFNTLQVYDPTLGAVWPIYANANWSMYAARFVFNGRQIAFIADDGTNTRVYVLNRDGGLASALPPTTKAGNIVGVPDGFIYTHREGGVPKLYSINLRAGDTDGSLVWTGVPNTFSNIVWVGALGSASFEYIDPPYPAWAMLGERTYESDLLADDTPVATEAPAPTAEPVGTATLGADPSVPTQLRIGDAALVTTGALRLRTMAGLGGSVIRDMSRNTYVRVIGGPSMFDNLIWWQVQMLDGTVGWAAEIVGTERVLTYTNQPPPSPTSTPMPTTTLSMMASATPTPTPTASPSLMFFPVTGVYMPLTPVFIPTNTPMFIPFTPIFIPTIVWP